MLKTALHIALLVAVISLLVTGTVMFGGVLPEHSFPIYIAAAAVAVLWALKLFCCRPVSFVWSPAHLPVVLFAGYAAARYLFSPIEYASRIELLHVGLYALTYFVVSSNFHRTRDRLVILGALVLLAAAQSAYGFWQYRHRADVVLWLDRGDHYHGRGSGTYFCPNHLAGLLEMALAMLVARLVVHRRPDSTLQSAFLLKTYEMAALALLAVGLFATLSRGGWIAMAAALLLFLIVAELSRVLSSRTVIAIFAGLVLVGAWVWSIPLARQRISHEIQAELDFISGTAPIQTLSGLGGRFPMWKATLRMIRDHPWLGTGGGTWQWFHLQYREPRLQIHPQFAHHDVLHLVSDYGAVGTLFVVAFLALFYRRTWVLMRRSESSEQRAFALGAFAAVTAIVVHSFVDFNLHIPANALWFVTIIALTFAQEQNCRRELKLPARFGVGLAALATGGVLAWFGAKQSLSARYTELLYEANQNHEWDDAQIFYARAVRWDAGNPEPHALFGDAYRVQSAMFDDEDWEAERHRLAMLAVDSYRQSLALNPFQSEVMLRLAAAQELAGDYEGAARTYARAQEIDPYSAFVWLRIGMFYGRRGDTTHAVEALKFSHKLNNLEPIALRYLRLIEPETKSQP